MQKSSADTGDVVTRLDSPDAGPSESKSCASLAFTDKDVIE